MTHSEAHLIIGADPHAVPPPELAEHLAGCLECTQFQREMQALDGNIRRALELSHLGTGTTEPPSVGETDGSSGDGAYSSAAITLTGARTRRRPIASLRSGWAIAASVALVFTLAVWALRPSDTLAHDVVRHMSHEPASWSSTEPVPAATVNEVMSKAGVTLDTSSNDVVYARTCVVHGHLVPHLVVRTANGPVTVLVLPDEKVKKAMSFHEEGMSGVITPAPHGSLAVLVKGDTDVDAIAAQVRQSVHWAP